MLRSRITPFLLLQGHGLVKTQKFADPKYVGDPINAVKIFNEKEVDELTLLDIDATASGKGPGFRTVARYRGGKPDAAVLRRGLERCKDRSTHYRPGL